MGVRKNLGADGDHGPRICGRRAAVPTREGGKSPHQSRSWRDAMPTRGELNVTLHLKTSPARGGTHTRAGDRVFAGAYRPNTGSTHVQYEQQSDQDLLLDGALRRLAGRAGGRRLE